MLEVFVQLLDSMAFRSVALFQREGVVCGLELDVRANSIIADVDTSLKVDGVGVRRNGNAQPAEVWSIV